MIYTYTGPDNLILGPENAGVTLNYYSTDTAQLHAENQQNPSQYYDSARWDNSDFEYRFNSLGFRTAELSDITPGSWFLALGCSYSVGVGLPQQYRWSDQLSELCGIPNLNLSLEGTGLDYCVYQSRLWIRNFANHLPEFVVIQHSESTRQLYSEYNQHGLFVGSAPAEHHVCDEQHHALADRDRFPAVLTTDFRVAQLTNIVTEMWNSVGVACYHWTTPGDGDNRLSDYVITEIQPPEPDCARDGSHDGVISNQYQAQTLWNLISESSGLNIPATTDRWWQQDSHQWASDHAERTEREQILQNRQHQDIIYR